MEVTSVEVLPADEEPAASLDGDPASPASTRTPSPTGCPGIRDEHEDDGRLAGALARPAHLGPHRHARTSASGRASDRVAAAHGLCQVPGAATARQKPMRSRPRRGSCRDRANGISEFVASPAARRPPGPPPGRR